MSETIQKILEGKELTQKELKDITDGDYNEEMEFIAEEEYPQDAGRWTYPAMQIFKLNNKHYRLNYERPLTEMQAGSEWYDQPYEVEKKVETVTKEIVSWVKIGNDESKQ